MSLSYEHLLGQAYVPGRVHCYQFVRGLYRDCFGIELRDYAIPHDWDANELDLIGMIHEREGFSKVPDWTPKTLRPGDILCTAIRSGNPNHFVVSVGGNKVAHHPLAQLSRDEEWRDFWRMSTCYVIRHPDVPDLTPKLPSTSIMELARARYRVQAEA